MIGFVPARKGSKRLPGKNMRKLGDTPLVGWTLRAAYESEVFDRVVVSTDWGELAEYAAGYFGAEIIMRPPHLATDESLDVEWIRHALGTLEYRDYRAYPTYAWFALLRPTSPFRGPEAIQRAVALWRDIKDHYDSLRAIRRATESAYKQWRAPGLTEDMDQAEAWLTESTRPEDIYEIEPVTSAAAKKHLHSYPTQELEPCYIQTAGLEICKTVNVLEKGNIAGDRVAGFLLDGPEALDLNDEADWEEAERLASLPQLAG